MSAIFTRSQHGILDVKTSLLGHNPCSVLTSRMCFFFFVCVCVCVCVRVCVCACVSLDHQQIADSKNQAHIPDPLIHLIMQTRWSMCEPHGDYNHSTNINVNQNNIITNTEGKKYWEPCKVKVWKICIVTQQLFIPTQGRCDYNNDVRAWQNYGASCLYTIDKFVV